MRYRVAVLTISYNSLELLKKAVASIQNQSFSDWVHIIVNDGSTDKTAEYLNKLAETSDQYIVRNLDKNSGIANARNQCLKMIPPNTEFVCILDADDIAREDKLEKQIKYLEARPDVGLVGSNCIFIDEQGEKLGLRKYPADELKIRKMQLIENPFTNSCVMYRSGIANGLSYSLEFPPCEDYDFWLNLLKNNKAVNLQEALVYYRVSSHQAVARSVKKMLKLTIKIKLKHILERKDFSPRYFLRFFIELSLLFVPAKLVLKVARARQIKRLV